MYIIKLCYDEYLVLEFEKIKYKVDGLWFYLFSYTNLLFKQNLVY